MMRCKGTKSNGDPCTLEVADGDEFCRHHRGQEPRTKTMVWNRRCAKRFPRLGLLVGFGDEIEADEAWLRLPSQRRHIRFRRLVTREEFERLHGG